jgi:osmotically-inducible protein OsmY
MAGKGRGRNRTYTFLVTTVVLAGVFLFLVLSPQTGWADHQKMEADIRKSVDGRASVSNKKIVSNIRMLFALDPFLKDKEIAVSVIHGHVYLSGFVNYEYEKTRAEELASRVHGVVKVSNELVGESVWTGHSDIKIHNDILTELWCSPFVDSDEVTIEVEHGVATLTGVVDSWTERHLAEENAYEGGAKEVINHLRLRPIVGG